jgi:transcription initiation factor IIE alpha subunit
MRGRADWRSSPEEKVINFEVLLHSVTMPIRIDEFESQPEGVLELDRDTVAFRILEFLAENSDQAYTPKEISEEAGVKRGSVGAVLSRLEDQGLVRHKGKYWAIAEDDRLASFTAMTQASSSSVDDDYFGE